MKGAVLNNSKDDYVAILMQPTGAMVMVKIFHYFTIIIFAGIAI